MALLSFFKNLFSKKESTTVVSYDSTLSQFQTPVITPEPVVGHKVDEDLEVKPATKKTIVKATQVPTVKTKKAETKTASKVNTKKEANKTKKQK